MPKMKSKSAAKKRFRKTANGKIKVGSAFRRHLLTKKNRKVKRKLRAVGHVSKADTPAIMKLLPYKTR